CSSRSLPTNADRSILGFAIASTPPCRPSPAKRELTERCAMAAPAVYAAGLIEFPPRPGTLTFSAPMPGERRSPRVCRMEVDLRLLFSLLRHKITFSHRLNRLHGNVSRPVPSLESFSLPRVEQVPRERS